MPFSIHLPLQIVLSLRALKVETSIVALYRDDSFTRDARKSMKGHHMVAFMNREDF
jgi:hypothetical protein